MAAHAPARFVGRGRRSCRTVAGFHCFVRPPCRPGLGCLKSRRLNSRFPPQGQSHCRCRNRFLHRHAGTGFSGEAVAANAAPAWPIAEAKSTAPGAVPAAVRAVSAVAAIGETVSAAAVSAIANAISAAGETISTIAKAVSAAAVSAVAISASVAAIGKTACAEPVAGASVSTGAEAAAPSAASRFVEGEAVLLVVLVVAVFANDAAAGRDAKRRLAPAGAA